MKQKILITGSKGTIGRVIVEELKTRFMLILIDKQDSPNSVDLLKDPLEPFFQDIDALIHLAAHPSPFIRKEMATENIEMVQRVIQACRSAPRLKKIINASSINVYPYFEMYKNKRTITRDTPLSPNLHFPPGEYAKSKIFCEKLFEEFCKRERISLINLRLGHVTSDDIVPLSNPDWKSDTDADIEDKAYLHHDDLKKIILDCLSVTGIQSFVCVSKPSWLFGKDILFSL